MIGRNDPCWCGSGKKWKKCHFPEKGASSKSFEEIKKRYLKTHHILIKDTVQVEGIRKSCHLAAKILDETCKMAKPGVTTQELNDFAHQMHLDAGAIPAPLNYGTPPFPKSICTSLNEVICHGIPDDEPLKDDDILNIDITCVLNGYFGDCSRMVMIGKVSDKKELVCRVSYECLKKAVSILKPNMPLNKIGDVIEEHAHKNNCSVVNQFVGHGVGIEFHEGPQVSHCRNPITTPIVPGMTFTIEPMINAGVRSAVIDPINHWTARTTDGMPSAQWEHTILVTDSGYEILTPWQDPYD